MLEGSKSRQVWFPASSLQFLNVWKLSWRNTENFLFWELRAVSSSSNRFEAWNLTPKILTTWSYRRQKAGQSEAFEWLKKGNDIKASHQQPKTPKIIAVITKNTATSENTKFFGRHSVLCRNSKSHPDRVGSEWKLIPTKAGYLYTALSERTLKPPWPCSQAFWPLSSCIRQRAREMDPFRPAKHSN